MLEFKSTFFSIEYDKYNDVYIVIESRPRPEFLRSISFEKRYILEHGTYKKYGNAKRKLRQILKERSS